MREYLREFSRKFETTSVEYLGARGTLIHEKNLKSKNSYQTSFKGSELREQEGGYCRLMENVG
jgi:hypothetical protein